MLMRYQQELCLITRTNRLLDAATAKYSHSEPCIQTSLLNSSELTKDVFITRDT